MSYYSRDGYKYWRKWAYQHSCIHQPVVDIQLDTGTQTSHHVIPHTTGHKDWKGHIFLQNNNKLFIFKTFCHINYFHVNFKITVINTIVWILCTKYCKQHRGWRYKSNARCPLLPACVMHTLILIYAPLKSLLTACKASAMPSRPMKRISSSSQFNSNRATNFATGIALGTPKHLRLFQSTKKQRNEGKN